MLMLFRILIILLDFIAAASLLYGINQHIQLEWYLKMAIAWFVGDFVASGFVKQQRITS